MNKIEVLRENLFLDCKNIIEHLSKINTEQDLLNDKSSVLRLYENLISLEWIKTNAENVLEEKELKEINNQFSNDIEVNQNFNEKEEDSANHNFIEPENLSLNITNPEALIEGEPELTHNNTNEENLASKEITEIENLQTNEDEHFQKEKKIKLANIKGINKNIQSLFDEDFAEDTDKSVSQPEKTIITTHPSEQQKAKPDFKLDLNDRIAFTQKLFGGSQIELNETVRTLNDFNNIDDAKEFLSDMYYSKRWDKVDEYAQRLWTLVENKFL